MEYPLLANMKCNGNKNNSMIGISGWRNAIAEKRLEKAGLQGLYSGLQVGSFPFKLIRNAKVV